MFLLCSFLFYPARSSQKISDIFNQANSLYEKGNFKEAISYYEQLVQSGKVSSDLYYNLGNACFKAGLPGRAILYYEKAMKFSPRNKELKQNLAYVRSLTVDKQFDEDGSIIFFLLSGMNGFLSINELTIIFMIFYFILFFTGLIYIFLPEKSVRFYNRIIASFVLFCFLISSFFLAIRIYDEEYVKKGIIMFSQEKARSGPGEDYTEVFTVHEGSKVFLRQTQGDWRQITLPSGYSGWVKNKSIEEI